MTYNFGDLGDLGSGLSQSLARLDQLNHQLKTQVGQLQEHWSSQDGFNAYIAVQRTFDTRLGTAKLRLEGIQKGVVKASEIMAGTDRAVGQSFNSLI